ncbi:hypothetical protein V8E54_005388 [Elaphomyces granulatus]
MPAASANRKPAGKARIPSPKPATGNDEWDDNSHHEDIQDSEAASVQTGSEADSEAEESDDILSTLNRRPTVIRSTPVVPLPRQVKISRTNRAVAVAENNAGIADSDNYLLWDRKRPDCDDRESGNKEDEVMRLVTRHLSAVTLTGEELSPWPETSAPPRGHAARLRASIRRNLSQFEQPL